MAFLHRIMTAERLLRLIQQPEQLDSIPYEELKTLVLAYPYSAHLRYLLLLKSKQIHHHEYNQNLSAAAALSPDRTRLYRLIVPLPVEVREEVLELKPIETILRNLEALSPLDRAENAGAHTAQQTLPTPPVEKDTTAQSPVPNEEEDFRAWINQFRLPPLPPPPPAPPAAVLAAQSVQEKEEVASETLAKILALQGHKDKAIAMYQRLMVANPEKSTIFAAAIEALKK